LPEKWFEDAEVPEFLVDYFVNFMFETPSFFKELGEADQYYHYVREWVDFLHLCVTTETDSPIWQQMAWVFTQRANFIPLYFNSQNLKEIYVKRAEIMEIALKQKGFQLDYAFPPRDKNRKKIKVGFLSNHFTPQTETFSTLPAFEHLERGFEVILYANMTNGHPLEKYCESRVDRLVQLPEDLNAKIQAIRQDDLDFLLIGTNTTAVTNQITILALHRLARIQGTLFSSPVTTGIKNMNFYISGELSEPLDAEEHYSEQVVKLKNTGYCFNYDVNPFDVTVNLSRQILGIAENSVVFSSGANVYKIVPELAESWAKILANVPNSILLLYPFAPSWSSSYPKEPFIKHLQLVLEKYNVKAEQLIIVESLPTRADVKECLKLVDIYLDSYPYTGSNSNVDPLELGLPVVVMEGNSMRTRQGAAILRSIGLDDLVVQDEESYINLAVKLGTDEKLRNQYREQILEKMSNNPPFLDSKAYSEQIGAILKQLFEKHL
jgi:predicted O-linked N-acetylglucosamine transferase (SPINDLY family)